MLVPEPEEEAVSWCVDSNLIKKGYFLYELSNFLSLF